MACPSCHEGRSSQTDHLVDPTGLGNVVASYSGGGSLIANSTYGLCLVSQTGPSDTGCYDFDASGNTVGVTGSGGSYVNQYSYLPFGETTTVSAALPNPFTFAGQVGVMQIGNNMISMRARDYAGATGQLLSNDPLGLAGQDTNLRRYVGNDPINGNDPSGKDPNLYVLCVFLHGVAFGAAAANLAPDLLKKLAFKIGFGIGVAIGVISCLPLLGLPTPPGISPSVPTGAGPPTGPSNGVLAGDPNSLIGPGGYGAQSFIQPTPCSTAMDWPASSTLSAQVPGESGAASLATTRSIRRANVGAALRPASSTSSWVIGVPSTPAAALETKAKARTSMPAWRATIASGTVDIPTTSAPSVRNILISAGVS